MSKITLSDGERHMRTLMHTTPLTAVRYGVLSLLRDALETGTRRGGLEGWPEQIDKVTAPLCSALDIESIHEVPAALQRMTGRPPRRVVAALRDKDFVISVANAFEALGSIDLSDRAMAWSPGTFRSEGLPALPGDGLSARSGLLGALRARARQIHAAWVAEQVDFALAVRLDGRSLNAAARAWQMPLVTGAQPTAPMATTALYPNRLGRTAAVVAYLYAPQAYSKESPAPDAWIFESLAMLVAVGEAIAGPDVHARRPAMEGHGVSEVVSVGSGPLGDGLFDVACWWPVFDAWGSQSERVARSVPTAWKLTDAEADVLVWVLCGVAARLAVAASARRSTRRGSDDGRAWVDHRDAELPVWTVGARSVWSLMQGARRFEERTAWPGELGWSLGDDSVWPWQVER